MQTDPEVMPDAVEYFRFYFLGSLALVLYNLWFTERVDLGLHNDICQTNHGILYAGGQAIVDDLQKHVPVETDLGQLHREDIAFLQKVDHTQNHACRLGNDGGQCGGPHTFLPYGDKEQVK